MKKYFIRFTLCLALMASLMGSCLAAVDEDTVKFWLEPAVGEWYNSTGELTLAIDGATIGGATVTDATDCTYGYPRVGTFQLSDNAGTRSMHLELFGNKSHQYLVVDNKTLLRRSLTPEYNESMGGIYLGMSKEALVQLYKEPTTKTTERNQDCWQYDSHKFAVLFKNDVIVSIIIYKDSDRRFDKSGLGPNDSPAAYAGVYGWSEMPVVAAGTESAPSYKIDQGEFFHFNTNYVELSVYKN